MSTIYDDLKKELLRIKDLVSNYPEHLQHLVLEALLSEFRASKRPHAAATPTGVSETPGTNARLGGAEGHEIPGVALINDEGKLKITMRELSGKTINERARQLAYVAIRAYEQLSGETKVSSKSVITPLLKQWRLYTGNTRKLLARDKGILREGDSLSLDVPAKQEADRFIAQIHGETGGETGNE